MLVCMLHKANARTTKPKDPSESKPKPEATPRSKHNSKSLGQHHCSSVSITNSKCGNPIPDEGHHRHHNVAILSYVDKSGAGAFHVGRFDMVRCNHMSFANRHGYEYISPLKGTDLWSALHLSGHGTRSKIMHVLLHMQKYDYVLWVDADVVFHNRNMSVQPWINRMLRSSADIMMTANDRTSPNFFDYLVDDVGVMPFNAGVMLIRNSPWAKDFFTNASEGILQRPLKAHLQDQPVFFRMWESNWEGTREHILIHDKRAELQAFTKLDEVTEESWLVHDTTCSDKTSCGLTQYVEPRCAALSGGETNRAATFGFLVGLIKVLTLETGRPDKALASLLSTAIVVILVLWRIRAFCVRRASSRYK